MISHAALNASLNGVSAILLAGGYAAISRKVIKPSSAETSRNPRARSAKVRCIERSSR